MAAERPLDVASHLGLVRQIARAYSRACRHLAYDDLFNEGVIGLMRALEKFDPARGHRFSTYAAYWIRQGCARAIANQERTVRLPVWRLSANNAAGVSNAQHIVSLDAPIGDTADGVRTGHDIHAAPEADEPDFEPSEVAAVHTAVDELPDRERRVVRARLRGRTFRDVGSEIGVSRERARQVERDAHAAVRRRLRGGAGRAA